MRTPEDGRAEKGAPDRDSRLKFALRALRHRNYRLFFGGQSLSLIGTWMTQVAMSWLVYRLTDSPWLLGIVGFSGQIPAFFLMPFAGVWVDRWDRHRVLKVTQALAMLQSLSLAALALSGRIQVSHIMFLAVFQGVINSFDMPARQSFVVEMIEDRADLANAIALNSTIFNGARLIGPSIAGAVIAVAGEGFCFLIDGLSYIPVIASLVLMRTRSSVPKIRQNVLSELRDGWKYIAGFAPIRSILTLIASFSLVGFPYSVLLPVFASTVLHGGPHTLGFLTAASGVGALVSAITLALRKTIVGLGRMIAIVAFSFGAALIALGISSSLWLTLPLMMILGFSMMQMMAASNTIMQTMLQEDKRGRVMSFYSLSFMGILPFGSLIAGALANRIGAPLTVIVGGLLCILVAIWFSLRLKHVRRVVRPIYLQLGILSEVAEGLQAATSLHTPPER
jgi:MFS family permease